MLPPLEEEQKMHKEEEALLAFFAYKHENDSEPADIAGNIAYICYHLICKFILRLSLMKENR
jgi:hypothetical protein